MSLKIHFLNVGDGDCTIIDFPSRFIEGTQVKYDSRVTMVDINHHENHDDYEHVIDYYRRNFTNSLGGVRPIFRYIASHPHEDHLTGFKALTDSVEVVNFWDIDHDFEPDQSNATWSEYEKDWNKYLALRVGSSNPKVLRYLNTDLPRPFWDEDGIEVLAPSKEIIDFVHKKEDGTRRSAEEVGQVLNNLSYVLLIRFNGVKILLAGDAEAKTWEHIVKNYSDKIKNIDILKASHHGRESGFHEEAIKIMNPKHVVFSMSEDCEHGVPEKYEKAVPSTTVHQTSEGTLVFDCGFDNSITFSHAE